MVPTPRFELGRSYALPPQGSVSTNSTTPAFQLNSKYKLLLELRKGLYLILKKKQLDGQKINSIILSQSPYKQASPQHY